MNVLKTLRHFSKIDEPVILFFTNHMLDLTWIGLLYPPHFRKDIDCLEKVQRRATKLISGFKNLSCEDSLRRRTPVKRRLRADVIKTFKIMTARERLINVSFSSAALALAFCQALSLNEYWLTEVMNIKLPCRGIEQLLDQHSSATRASDSCLMLDYVRDINFRIIIMIIIFRPSVDIFPREFKN